MAALLVLLGTLRADIAFSAADESLPPFPGTAVAPAEGALARPQDASPTDSLPAASAEISADSVAVGDRFTLSIVTRHRGERRVLLPEWSAPSPPESGSGSGSATDRTAPRSAPTGADSLPRLGDLRILRVGSPRVRSGANGTRIDSVPITVTTFALDSAGVPSVPIRMAGETDTLELRTAARTVAVRSLVPADAGELRDLAPIASFARPLWPWLAGALGAVAALAAAVYWMRRNTEEESSAAAAEKRTDPYEEAQERLDALAEFEFGGEDRVKPFFVELADCLRTLIRRTRGIPAPEMTTAELLGVLRDRSGSEPVDEEAIRRLEVVLRLCDLAKFADARPPAEDSRSALRAARAAVNRMEERDRAGRRSNEAPEDPAGTHPSARTRAGNESQDDARDERPLS